MKKTPISRRLLKIASLLQVGCTMADIGTDHGYLPSYLIDQDICPSVIMSDINKGPLESAKLTFSTFHPSFQSKNAFRLGAGLEKIQPYEVDTIVIAGMGGGLIRDILNKDIQKTKSFKTLILQPQTEQEEFRAYILNELNYHIVCEAFIEESGKYYEILQVEKNKNNQYEVFQVNQIVDDLEFGHSILRSDMDEYKKFLVNKRNKYEFILKKLPLQAEYEQKRKVCDAKLKSIEIILEAVDDNEY